VFRIVHSDDLFDLRVGGHYRVVVAESDSHRQIFHIYEGGARIFSGWDDLEFRHADLFGDLLHMPGTPHLVEPRKFEVDSPTQLLSPYCVGKAQS